MSKQVKKIINNKTVHFEIAGTVHKKLRAMLFLREVSMQEFFRLMSEQVVLQDPYILKLIDERVSDIKNKKLDKLRNVEDKDLYAAIEENSPFKN